jgi:dsDNA-specific endonuclease/ATPase MutS2
MPKRILLPILITTSVIGIGTGTYIATQPLSSYAQISSNLPINSSSPEVTRTIEESFVGQRPRSNDFAYAKDLGVDTSKVEDAQTKVKEAEVNLKTEMQNTRTAIKDAIVTKARAKNISNDIIGKYEETYQKLTDSQRELKVKLANGDTTIQSIRDLRTKINDNLKNFKQAETTIKQAII